MHPARAALIACIAIAVARAQPPRLVRVFPLGGQAGATISVEILGERLSNVSGVEFDALDIQWKAVTFASPHRLVGQVGIAPSAALGLHSFRVLTLDGPTNSGLFQVGALPSVAETEPNDSPHRANAIPSFPADIHGRLDRAPDIDVFTFTATAGQRIVLDMKSIEDGSAVEARMILLDAAGRQLAFNDDRDDYNENPRIEHTFSESGKHFLKLDQYRGPRGFNFGKLSAYILRIGSMPVVTSAQPRVLQRGSSSTIRLHGSGLDSIRAVYLTEARPAEYSRMTFPFTMPIRFRPDPPTGTEVMRISGSVVRSTAQMLETAFTIPASAPSGLWRIRVVGADGPVDVGALEVTDWRTVEEQPARSGPLEPVRLAIAGSLDRGNETDTYTIHARAGKPLQIWTLAEQIGVPHLDSVITLRDASGRRLAENDDVVAGQGTLLGNPDSRLFFTPDQDGLLFVEVRDRTGRGGPGFDYVLKADAGQPGFQLFTTPENFTVAQGQTAELRVHLVREAGFEGEIEVWAEGLPDGFTATRGRFRSDQLFEPNADGADMVIPELALKISAPPTAASGRYVVRVLGSPVAQAGSPHRLVVEACSTLMLGPLLDAWNFVRRPLPAIAMTVVVPNPAQLTSSRRAVQIQQGGSATLEFTARAVGDDAVFRVLDLPLGVESRITGREEDKVSVFLKAEPQAAPGTYEISAEADVGARREPSGSITLTILPAETGADTQSGNR